MATDKLKSISMLQNNFDEFITKDISTKFEIIEDGAAPSNYKNRNLNKTLSSSDNEGEDSFSSGDETDEGCCNTSFSGDINV